MRLKLPVPVHSRASWCSFACPHGGNTSAAALNLIAKLGFGVQWVSAETHGC